MHIWQALVLGLVQGLTEFIPVSSSGHLVLMRNLIGAPTGGLAFDVALHLGTFLALMIFFWKDFVELLRSIFKKNDRTHLAYMLVIATIPAAIIGYLLEGAAETTFRSSGLAALNLGIFGTIMLLVERHYSKKPKHKNINSVKTNQALAIGSAQALAIVPGFSRSATTIVAGMLSGLDRVSATRFSFLMAAPITFGAILKIFSEQDAMSQFSSEKTVVFVGIVTALISGLIAIKFMLKYLAGHGLQIFAYYRIALATVVLAALVLS